MSEVKRQRPAKAAVIPAKAAVIPELSDRDIVQFIMEHLKNANLLRAGDVREDAPDSVFDSNEAFWHDVIRGDISALRWVTLSEFQVTQWFPRSPGLYHTNDARWQREKAQQYVREVDGVAHYMPDGKGCMIDGGIGAVRFQPIRIDGTDAWLGTATSDRCCHSGIPIAVPNHLAQRFDVFRGGRFSLTGQVRFLPEFLEEHFRHYNQVPQLYVVIDTLERTAARVSPVTITPMVCFEGQSEYRDKVQSVTYVQCNDDSNLELDRATEWLEWYVQHYGTRVLTDYDQQRPAFRQVPFALEAVLSGAIRASELECVHIHQAEIVCKRIRQIISEVTTVNQNVTVTLGDGIVIHGDMIVAHSINDSFNRAKDAEVEDTLKEALTKLVSAVGQLTESLAPDAAKAIARDLNALTQEATSELPRRVWWELSLKGIKDAAASVAAIGKPVLELAEKVAAFLAGKS